MAQGPHLSVIIPAYNEEPNFKKGTVNEVPEFLKKQGYTYEILIVDDGSSDNTASLAQDFANKHDHVRVIKNSHEGKAATVKTGVKEAKGDYILFTDFDQATPISEVEKLLPYFSQYDIVIGSRQLPGAKREKEPIHRHIMGLVFNIIVQIIAIRGIWDTQAGFKCFKAQIAKELFGQLKVYGKAKKVQGALVTAFDVELLFIAKKRGFKIKEVPIIWHHVSTSRVSPIKDSLRMLRDVIKIRLNDLRGVYN
ncbi:MAG: Glycosyl transferase family 2 [Candidatus Curtissbacteria bacterium GW2011_GWA1_40_16]|uniref:dolichyl-phosphate beta-glucosyltransferase n=1 Tax=Candidatus Curtissbacteria bacterium GW2011_GWA1_40_16 TaxID=1618405 RepID=A0A0G0RG04_9BACT|nr:MAG: Glycosyl transferase family 2 [Candidatus Curtissbacteria bacterium GW2011_GWA1_40_16]